MKTELQLQGLVVDVDADIGDLHEADVENDFNEDVLEASSSDAGLIADDGQASDSAAESAPDSVLSSQLDFDAAAAEGPEGHIPLHDDDPTDGLPPATRKCLHHWHLTMGATLRAFRGLARNPRAAS